jgi:hypothetical protein
MVTIIYLYYKYRGWQTPQNFMQSGIWKKMRIFRERTKPATTWNIHVSYDVSSKIIRTFIQPTLRSSSCGPSCSNRAQNNGRSRDIDRPKMPLDRTVTFLPYFHAHLIIYYNMLICAIWVLGIIIITGHIFMPSIVIADVLN